MYDQSPRKVAPPDDVDEYLSRYTKNKVREEAQKQGVDPDLASRQFGQESAYKPDVIKGQRRSSKGAIGVSQLMPGTAKEMGIDPYNIEDNVRGGVGYMKKQLATFGGDTRKALAAYNAGPGAVQKAGGVPRFKETQDYVNKIAGPEQKDDVDEFLSRWKEPAQSTESPSPTPPPVSKPSPRVTKNGSPGVFARNQQQRIESTAEARNALNFRPAGGESARMQEQSNRLERRVAYDPRKRAEVERVRNQTPLQQAGEVIGHGFLTGAEGLGQVYGALSQNPITTAYNLATTRKPAGNLLTPAAQQTMSEQQAAQDIVNPNAAPIGRGLTSAATQLPAYALLPESKAAQMIGGGAIAAAQQDWSNPARAAIGTGIGAVGGPLGSAFGKGVAAPVVKRLASPITRTVAENAGQVIGGAAGNVIPTAAEQLAYEGELNPQKLAHSAVIGGAQALPGMRGPGAMRQRMERAGIEDVAARAQDRPGQQGTTITNLQGAGLPTPAERLGQISPVNVESAPKLRTLPQGDAIQRTIKSGTPEVRPRPEAAPVKAPDFRSVADDAKIQASQAEQAGNFGAAAAQYDAARQSLARLRRASAKTADAQTLADLDTEINLANQNKVRAMNAQRAAARQQPKSSVTLNEKPTVSTESKSELQASKPEVQPTQRVAREGLQSLEVANEPTRDLTAPLLRHEARVNPEGGIPKLPTEPVDFTRLAERQNEQMANEGAKPAKRIITRIAEMGGINMDKHGGEMQSAKDARRVGLLRRKGVSPDLMAQQLRDEGFDVDPNDLNTLWRAIDADVSGQVRPPNTRDLNERLAREESEYEANRPESEPLPANKNNASVKMMLTRDDHQQLADLGYSREERNAMTPQQGAEIIANGQRKATIPPNAETEAEIRAAAAEYGRKPQTGPIDEELPTGQLVRRPAELSEVTAMRQRESLSPQERQEALRQAVPKGQFGKLSEQSYKRGDNASSLVEHPQLRKLLGLGEMPPYHLPDAEINPKTGQPFVNPEWTTEAQKTLNELARLSGKERSSQINFGPGERTPEGKPTRGEMGDLYKSIQKIARSKGERLEPSLDVAFKKTVEGARLNQRGWQEFSVDERTENIRKSLDEIYRKGTLSRAENTTHRDAFREIAAEYGLSKNQADELFAGTKAEARQRAERGGDRGETAAARVRDTAGSQRMVGQSSEGTGTSESVSRERNAEAPNVAKDTIGNQADIAAKLADITELERFGIYSKKEADAARSKLKFSVGKLEDEPQGPIAAAGLGGLQDIFSRNRRNPDDVELPPIDENLKRTAPPVERGLGTVRLEGKGRVESGPLPDVPPALKRRGITAKPVSADEYLNRAIQRPSRPALSEGQKAERGAKTVLSRAAKGVQAGTIQDEQRVRITNAADALLKASRSGDAKGIEEANRQLKQAMKSPDELDASTLEKISAARKAFMLSRPVTHLRNIIGNTFFQGAEEIARIPGSAIDTVLRLGTGRRALAGANIFEISKAAGHAIDVTYTAARRGIDAASAKLKGPSEQMGKLQDVKEIHFKNGWLDKGVNGIFKSLDAEDKVFFSAAYGRALHEQAKLTARNSKGAETIDSLLKNPTPEMELNAAMVADVAVFRNKNKISNAIRSARGQLGSKGNFVADMYLPFDKTPTNIILRAIEYSPAGLVGAAGKGVAAAGRGARGAYRGSKEGLPAREVVSKAIDEALPIQQQRRISQLVGRGLVGTALMGLGYGLAASGRMTGYYDEDDPKGEAMKRATGARPLSIRLGGRWYSVSGIAPVGYLLGLGATLHDEMNKKDGNLIGGSAKAMYEMVSEMPMLKTIGDLGKSIKSISKDRGNAGREVGRQVGSFIPGAFDTLGQAVPYVRDPYEREIKYPYKAKVSPGRKAVVEGAREIGAKIPGARRLLPVKKDALGRPIQTEYLDILDPFSSRPATGPIKRR